MMQRQMIASKLTQQSDSAIRRWYLSQAGKDVPVHLLHVTLIPPFTSQRMITVGRYACFDHEIKIDTIGLFTQKSQMLYLHLDADCLYQVRGHLWEQNHEVITVDVSAYKDGEMPEFEPHITLDYQFDLEVVPDWPVLPPPIRLEQPQVFIETDWGKWEEQG